MRQEEQDRFYQLQEYVKKLMIGDNKKKLYEEYSEAITKVVPLDIIKIEYIFLSNGIKVQELLKTVDMLMNVFHKGLVEYQWEKPTNDSFLFYLMEENKQIILTLNNLKKYIGNQSFESDRDDILMLISDIKSFDCHYIKIENIIFPLMQEKAIEFNGLAIMWELHVVVRNTLRKLKNQLHEIKIDRVLVNKIVGKLFPQIHGLIKKEELILFPLVTTMINDTQHQFMLEQSGEYNYYHVKSSKSIISFSNVDDALTIYQAKLLFNHLPFDVTYIDEFDKVTYFNKSKNPIFPRSANILGRDVRQCHPPKSVHIVEKILKQFKSGGENKAVFWINVNNRKVLISYFAINDEKNNYKGVIEVVQDITKIQTIKGEKRLLEW